MPAVLRIKRSIDEEPLSAFLLNSKRRRLNNADSAELNNDAQKPDNDEVSTVLTFAGTINVPDDKATTELAFLKKDTAKDAVRLKRRNVPEAVKRMRQTALERSEQNRFHVVNCLRKILDNEIDDEKQEVAIVDIEKKNSEPSASNNPEKTQELNSTEQSEFVYDIYLQNDDQDIQNIDFTNHNHISIHGYDNLVYEDYYNNSESDEYDSEDSNHEDHYTNDYPDEESNFDSEGSNNDDSDDDHGLRSAIKKFVLDDDEDSYYSPQSSEDEDYSYEDYTFDE